VVDAKDHIAVVGMAGRFPGASNMGEFWQLLEDGVEAIRSFTPEELEKAGVPRELARDPSHVPASGYLEGIERFDAAFFGMTPREAEMTDPQHRIFLESAWHALEDAGHMPDLFDGRIGVYAGCGLSTYLLFHLFRNPELPAALNHLQFLIGNSSDYLPTRVSYKLNLKGPSVNVNTACSSSLVAVHLACQALLDYECDMVLAGGAAIQLPQDQGYIHQEHSITSPDGHCRPFDAKAAGTVGGNGVGVVALRRLEDALADGDTIRAVILGSAINNDGADKVGYTAPSASGQTRVIAEALSMADVDPETIQYIETHGTGTRVGDPIEIQALTKAFGESDRVHSCAIGSVKANIGHLDEAAGVTGLIKTVLALEHGKIPPSLHFETPNPEIDFEGGPFYVNAELQTWPDAHAPRRAGVSSFGIGGTNAHVVLEQGPSVAASAPCHIPLVVPVSARTAQALEQARSALADHLETQPSLSPTAVAQTLQVGRRAFAHRSFSCGYTLTEIADQLRSESLPTGSVPQDQSLAFMFPGQGSQHEAMANELYETQSYFHQELDRGLELLRQHAPEESLAFFVSRDTKRDVPIQTDAVQPALFCVEFALARLWMHWGVTPDYLIGHSLGEYVAACLSGVFSLEDGVRIVSARGRLMQSIPAGAMLALPMAEADVIEYLTPHLDVAAVNSPNQVVVSGPETEIKELEESLARLEVSGRRLTTSHAFHSAMMDPAVDAFDSVMRSVSLSEPRIPIVSNTTGRLLSTAQALDPAYWSQHIRETVRFGAGVDFLVGQSCAVFLEVGPADTLTKITGRMTTDTVTIATLPRPRETGSDQRNLASAVGRLWTAGVDVNWQTYSADTPMRRIPLPGYPFSGERHWVDPTHGDNTPREAQGDAAKVDIGHIAVDSVADLDDWFHRPLWRQQAKATDTWKPTRCLVFDDGQGLGDLLRDQLESAGVIVHSVLPGATYQTLDDGRFELDPAVPDGYEALIGHLDEAPDLVIHLWSLTTQTQTDVALDCGFYSLVYFTQALTHRFVTPKGRWILCTPPAHEVTGKEPLTPIHATLSGIASVMPLEFPSLMCRHVDMDLCDVSQMAQQIQDEFRMTDAPSLVAWRDSNRWIRNWEPQPLAAVSASARIVEDGTYLMTGGAGSMGLAFAEYFGQQASCRLILTGRSALPERETWDVLLSRSVTNQAPSELGPSPDSRPGRGQNDIMAHAPRFEEEALRQFGIQTLDKMPDLARTLDQLSASLVYHHVFGPVASGQPTWTREALSTSLSVSPKFKRLFDGLLGILIEDGVFLEEADCLRIGQPPPMPMSISKFLEEQYGPYAGIGAMLSHCAERLVDVVSEVINPLEVLYPDGTGSLFKTHFATVPPFANDEVYLHMVGRLVRQAAESAPTRPLRILEVGGGTGGLTQVVLEALDGIEVDYTFTDLGPSFVNQARQESTRRGYGNVRFAVLDISQDLVDQGLAPTSFDIVVGYNVLHATPDIGDCLSHLTRTLVPGGTLLLVETVRDSRLDLLIWGLTEGWWCYRDTDLRQHSPILSLDQWDEVLSIQGLEGQTFPVSPDARVTTAAGLVIARTHQSSSESPGQQPDGSSGASAVCRTIRRIKAIEQSGSTVEYIRADVSDPEDMEHLRQHIKSRWGALDGIVHTAGELGQGLLSLKSREEIDRTFAPKVYATPGLEELLKEFAPSFLLLCSSMSSIKPIVGQVDYASANAFLDSYAHAANREFETRVVSITWGFWQELGMIGKARGDLTQQRDLAARIENSNLRDAGVRAFARILESASTPQIVVSPDTLSEIPAQLSPTDPWFDRVIHRSDQLVCFEGTFSPDTDWILDEHEVLGRKILPGTAYLEFVRAAFVLVDGHGPMELRDVYFLRPLVVDPGSATAVRAVLQKRGDSWDFTILSQTGSPQQDTWIEHARGEVGRLDHEGETRPERSLDLKALRLTCRGSEASSPSARREAFEASMTAFGPHWHNLVHADFDQDQALGEFDLLSHFGSELAEILLHPALLDNATGFFKVWEETGPAVPFSYRSVRILEALPAHVYSHASLRDDVDDDTASYDISITDPDGRVVVEIEGYAMRMVSEGGTTSRLFTDDVPANAALALGQPGSLSTFFVSAEPRRAPVKEEVEIEVRATGLNFIEVLYSLGMLPNLNNQRFLYGLECSGIVRRCGPDVERFQPGDEVLAFTNGCYQAFTLAPAHAVANKPENLSMEQAATLPAAYMTAWHALTGPGRLVAGESVLIHSAAGGVGLAAVHVARLLGAEVVATAGTQEKREYLTSIGVRHVSDSRTAGFGRQIMEATNGDGVDLVLNSLGQEFTGESMSVLARYGRFIELGKRAIFANASLEMEPFQRQLTFAAVDVGPDLPDFAGVWCRVMSHVAAEELPPLPLCAFPATEPAEGFQYMARGRHIGKIVFTFDTPHELLSLATQSHAEGRSFTSIFGLETDRPPARNASSAVLHESDAASSSTQELDIESDLSTATQQGIARIWRDLLGVSSIQLHDSFFDLNGDSLLAAQVISLVHREFGVKLPFSALFDAPTVEQLALVIDTACDTQNDEQEEGVI